MALILRAAGAHAVAEETVEPERQPS